MQSGTIQMAQTGQFDGAKQPLYTAEQRARRDATCWTTVQGVLAPLQFLVFAVSLTLVLRFLATDTGHGAAAVSVLIKTVVLFAIMVTGAIWEREVFGQYLFAPAFFWEDVVSMLVIALHVAYVVMFALGFGTAVTQMLVALLAYGLYVINAAQYLWKFRRARLAQPEPAAGGVVAGVHA
ncbi:MAG: 2-vinyl bacteriochlorophyllide hydratase [Pseudomonadales bacterium]